MGSLDDRSVRPFANQIDVQVRARRMQRIRRFDKFTKTFLHIHAPDVNNGLRGRVDASFRRASRRSLT